MTGPWRAQGRPGPWVHAGKVALCRPVKLRSGSPAVGSGLLCGHLGVSAQVHVLPEAHGILPPVFSQSSTSQYPWGPTVDQVPLS